jgi:hypothetical protein
VSSGQEQLLRLRFGAATELYVMLYKEKSMSLVRSITLLLLIGFSERIFADQPVPAPDNSMQSMAYIIQGMPSYDRIWIALDIKKAVVVLQKIAASDATLLPRRGSAKSGELFARIVSFENLMTATQMRTTQQQVGTLASILKSHGELLSLYESATTKVRSYDAELIDLMIVAVEEEGTIIEVVDQSLPTMAENDPLKEGALSLMQAMQKGLSTTLVGIVYELADHTKIRTSEIVRLAQAITSYIVRLYRHIPAGTLQEIRIKISAMIESETDESLIDALKGVAASLSQ